MNKIPCLEIDGPCREYDTYVMPYETDAEIESAWDFVTNWVEYVADSGVLSEEGDAVSFKIRRVEHTREYIDGLQEGL